jgi:hypothetical protein
MTKLIVLPINMPRMANYAKPAQNTHSTWKMLLNIAIFSAIDYFFGRSFGKGPVPEIAFMAVNCIITGCIESVIWYVLEPASAPKKTILEFASWALVPALLLFAWMNFQQYESNAQHPTHAHHHHHHIVRKLED